MVMAAKKKHRPAAIKKQRTIGEVYQSGKSVDNKFKPMSSLYKAVYSEADDDEESTVGIFSQEPADQTPEFIGSVSQQAYSRVKRAVLSNAKGGVRQYVAKLFELTNWPEQVGKMNLLDTVSNIFADFVSTNDIKGLAQHVERKENNKLDTFARAVKRNQPFNLSQIVKYDLKQFTKDPDGLMRELTSLAFQIATVGVGQGEVALTLATNATKGETGDLFLPGLGEVELKGNDGRVGKGTYIHNSIDNLEAWLTKKDENLEQYQSSNLLGGITVLLDKLIAMQNNEKVVQRITGRDDELMNWRAQGTAIIDDIKVSLTNGEIVSQEQIAALQGLVCPNFAKCNKTYDNTIKQVIGSYEVSAKTNKAPTSTHRNTISDWNRLKQLAEYKATTTHAFGTIFGMDHGLNYDEYTSALAEMRTEPFDGAKLESLKQGIRDVISPTDMQQMIQSGGENPDERIKRIGAAIQIAGYQDVMGFSYILFANTSKTMNALPISFDSKGDPGRKVVDVYKQMKPYTWKIPLNVDARNNGFAITFNQ